jgi:hypothetical protein
MTRRPQTGAASILSLIPIVSRPLEEAFRVPKRRAGKAEPRQKEGRLSAYASKKRAVKRVFFYWLFQK